MAVPHHPARALLESSVLGRHLLASTDTAHARSLIGLTALPTDGTTDIGPLIQAAYDDGAETIQLTSGVTYLWNSPVFLDRDSQLGGFVIEGNRARIRLGGGLPRSSWPRDTATRFAVFPNTRRTALAGGSVTVGSGTRATGTDTGAVRALVLRNVVLDGNGTNTGFSYANRTAVTFDQVTLWRARVGATWADYSDGNAFLNCYSRYGGGPSQQTLIEQVTPGDGLVAMGGKADTPVAFARLKTCRGAVLQGLVTARLVFDQCDAITVLGSHFEGQESGTAMVTVKNSRVSFASCVFYQPYSDGVPGVLVDDSSTTLVPSDVALEDCTAMQLGTAADSDVPYGPVLQLGTVLTGTRIAVRGLQGKQATAAAPGSWRDSAQPLIAGPAAVAAALGSDAGRAVQATGDLRLRRSGAGWEVVPAADGPVVSTRQSGAPTIGSVQASTASAARASLVPFTAYTYVAAVRDALGDWSALSATGGAVAGTSGMLVVEVSPANAPAVLVLWRATAADAATAADRFAVLPVRAALVALHDTGDHVAGVPWTTTAVPTPSVVAATNTTRDAILLNGRVVAQ